MISIKIELKNKEKLSELTKILFTMHSKDPFIKAKLFPSFLNKHLQNKSVITMSKRT